jgi:hypothetical protein
VSSDLSLSKIETYDRRERKDNGAGDLKFIPESIVTEQISMTTEEKASELGLFDRDSIGSAWRLSAPGENKFISDKDFEANKPNATIKNSLFKRNQTVKDALAKE